jgi:hypothetical protein
MTRSPALMILLVAGAAFAKEPRRNADDDWIRALNAANEELAVCTNLGGKLYGDVVVKYERSSRRWSRSASKSLDAFGEKAAACVQDAIVRHYTDNPDAESFDNTLEHTLRIGTPVIMLPPIAKLLPAWRRAAHSAKARGELAKLLPPDYRVTANGCLKTDREALDAAEFLWLPSTGAYVPRLWNELFGADVAMWRGGGELVTKGGRGVCLEQLDTMKLHSEMAKLGSCWAGSDEDVLVRPHVELPADVAEVSTEDGAICTLSTAGEVTCCGRAMPTPPKGPFTQVATGRTFACAIDPKGNPVCWGAIGAPPTGPFTKISAEYSHACGVRPSGSVECWGDANGAVTVAPSGVFTDVAAASFSTCGVHRDGSVQCWGESQRAAHPPGKFVKVAANWTHACGVRSDGTIGCWSDEGGAVDTPLPGEFVEVAVGDSSPVCGRRKDGTIACAGSQPDPKVASPPAGSFVQLAGSSQTFCALAADHHVTCWGDRWPGSYATDTAYPWLDMLGVSAKPPAGSIALTGRILDENGKPIAGAEVLACSAVGPCTSVGKRAVTTRGTLAELGGKGTVTTTTASDGTYRAIVAKSKTWGEMIQIVATAPGREVVTRDSEDPLVLAGDIVLRPASSLDVAFTCDGKPCTGVPRLAISEREWFEGEHLEKLPPGTHTIEAFDDYGKPGERRGTATIDVTYSGLPQRVTVAAKPIGTGKTIRGTAPPWAHVYARCGTGRMIFREATADSKGTFKLDDVGPLPCTLMLGTQQIKVTALPANITL